ncbi:hypothetical protein [Streptomyces sp. NPDC019890]|uniref:hypothetical protein n=1 Tax=Streptomyces sp. NPDC019890 TaxID=3365064 RepID=UPI003850B18E
MRTKPLFTAAAALFVLTACGSGGGMTPQDAVNGAGAGTGQSQGDNPADPKEGTLENPTKNGGVNGSAPDGATGFDGLPVAGSMKAAFDYVATYSRCKDLGTRPDDERFYSGDSEKDAGWGVTERGVCSTGHREEWTRIFMVSDMKKFQGAYKADLYKQFKDDPEAGLNGGFAIGQDFAVVAVGDDEVRGLGQSQLLILNCNPSFAVPSGYKKEKALVEGCVLTDFTGD